MKYLFACLVFVMAESALASKCDQSLQKSSDRVQTQVIQDFIRNKRAVVSIGNKNLELFVDGVRVLKPGRAYVFRNIRTKSPFAYFTDSSAAAFCEALGFGSGDGDIYSQNNLGFFFHRPTMISIGKDGPIFGEWANYLSPNIECYLSPADEPVDNGGQ